MKFLYHTLSWLTFYGIFTFGANNKVCISRPINDPQSKKPHIPKLWHLDAASPDVKDAMNFIHFDKDYDPKVDIIVVDSGIDDQHPQFADIPFLRLHGKSPTQKALTSEHGTMVAGVIVGKDFGVLRAANTKIRLVDVRLTSMHNRGILSSWPPALKKILEHQAKEENKDRRLIINYSFGFFDENIGKDDQKKVDKIKDMVKKLSENGAIQIAAAGKDGKDASRFFPANSPYTITVGAHDKSMKRRVQPNMFHSINTNFGSIIDYWAPGESIISAAPTNIFPKGFAGSTSTSIAAPFVTGMIATIAADTPEISESGIRQRINWMAKYEVDDGHQADKQPRVQIRCWTYCGIRGACIPNQNKGNQKNPGFASSSSDSDDAQEGVYNELEVDKDGEEDEDDASEEDVIISDNNDYNGDAYDRFKMTLIPLIAICLCLIIGCVCFAIGGSIVYAFKHKEAIQN